MSGQPQSSEIDRALIVAQGVHAGQTRKGARGEAYILHVTEVADPKGVSEEVRRRHQVEAVPGLSAPARILKPADKTSNIEEMAAARARFGDGAPG